MYPATPNDQIISIMELKGGPVLGRGEVPGLTKRSEDMLKQFDAWPQVEKPHRAELSRTYELTWSLKKGLGLSI